MSPTSRISAHLLLEFMGSIESDWQCFWMVDKWDERAEWWSWYLSDPAAGQGYQPGATTLISSSWCLCLSCFSAHAASAPHIILHPSDCLLVCAFRRCKQTVISVHEWTGDRSSPELRVENTKIPPINCATASASCSSVTFLLITFAPKATFSVVCKLEEYCKAPHCALPYRVSHFPSSFTCKKPPSHPFSSPLLMKSTAGASGSGRRAMTHPLWQQPAKWAAVRPT